MIFHTEERELVLDLTGDLATLKDKPFIIKEGCQYRIKIEFKIQNEKEQSKARYNESN